MAILKIIPAVEHVILNYIYFMFTRFHKGYISSSKLAIQIGLRMHHVFMYLFILFFLNASRVGYLNNASS